jgi:hypothetical protein
MKRLIIFFALAAVAGICLASNVSEVRAQSCDVAAAPDCPYGYFDTTPFACAPFGYYGPEWFKDGAFIGAGPWYKGPDNFHGKVNNHFDPQKGYKGPTPNHGEKADPSKHPDKVTNFKGNEVRDGHGHTVDDKH